MGRRDGYWEPSGPAQPEWLARIDTDERQFIQSLSPEPDAMPEAVNTSTGELVPLPSTFEPKAYLTGLRGSYPVQQALAAAYDEACAALIGPNDQQQEGGRTFKKKSAWRKLARHFGISTQVVHREREYLNDEFIASITVRAVAPWGQYAEAEGACCTDEATGRRVITVADAIATAETRATNRAVSNLIAMGEVSAEELGGTRPERQSGPRGPKSDADKKMPIGTNKGQRLGSISTLDLSGTLAWCRGTKDPSKWADLIGAIERVLEDRRMDEPIEAEVVEPETGEAVDDLPFSDEYGR